MGVLIEHAGLTNGDALAALRAYAYGHGASLDDIAHKLTPDAYIPTHSSLTATTKPKVGMRRWPLIKPRLLPRRKPQNGPLVRDRLTQTAVARWTYRSSGPV